MLSSVRYLDDVFVDEALAEERIFRWDWSGWMKRIEHLLVLIAFAEEGVTEGLNGVEKTPVCSIEDYSCFLNRNA